MLGLRVLAKLFSIYVSNIDVFPMHTAPRQTRHANEIRRYRPHLHTNRLEMVSQIHSLIKMGHLLLVPVEQLCRNSLRK